MATAMTWSSSRPDTRPTVTTSSPSQGERYTGIIALVGPVQSGGGKPIMAAIIALQGVMVFPDPVPLSRTPTRISSLRTCVG
jgi:hypothetical protein